MQMSFPKAFSLVAVALIVGCSQQSTTQATTEPKASSQSVAEESSATHSHGSGPHGGTIADWGGGTFHVEFTVDHDQKVATVYILGSDAKTPAPIKSDKLLLSINEPQFQVELLAKPLEGESEGSASRFASLHDNLGKVQEFTGTISGEVEGKPYAGDFKEEPEGHTHN